MRRTLIAICAITALTAVTSYSHAETLEQFMSPHQPVVEGSPMAGGAGLFTDYKGFLYRKDTGYLLVYATGFKHEPDQLCERIQAAEVPGLVLNKVSIFNGISDACNNH